MFKTFLKFEHYYKFWYRLINLTDVNHFKGETLRTVKFIEIGLDKFDSSVVSESLILLTGFCLFGKYITVLIS